MKRVGPAVLRWRGWGRLLLVLDGLRVRRRSHALDDDMSRHPGPPEHACGLRGRM